MAKIKRAISPHPLSVPGPADLSLAKSRSGLWLSQRRTWRKADKFLLFVLGNLLLLGLMFLDAARRTEAGLPRLREEARIVSHLGLTDLCLSTEAPYTRQPSQADGHAPFQSHPLALDLFPTGAVVLPRK